MAAIHGASPEYYLQHLFWIILDWLYPPRCAGCNAGYHRWCTECRSQVKPIDHTRACPICDYPDIGNNKCPDCANSVPVFTALRSFTIYEGPFRNAIHRLKYHSDIGIAEILGNYLVEVYSSVDWQPDLITAVPLSPDRYKQRGYNQSALVARYLSWRIKIPFAPKAVVRAKETTSQVGLDGNQRRSNVENAFLADPQRCRGKSILLIDDVATTGATLSSCAQAFHRAGASRVFGLTLARAIHLNMS